MNCRKAELLINRYLENRLDAAEMAFFSKHLAGCRSCSSSLKLAKALMKEQRTQTSVKAPEDFTDSVMAAVCRVNADKSRQQQNAQKGWSAAYGRLGFSLVLTAGIVLFTFLLPALGGYAGIPGPASGSSNGSGYIDVFSGFDAGVKGILNTINKSVIDFKGGTNNEM